MIIWTLKTLLITSILFFSCTKTQEDSRYSKEYVKYEQQVGKVLSKIPKAVKNSMNIILDDYSEATSIMSCTWCVAEGEVFKPVSDFCNLHPEALSMVLDRSLTKNHELVWGFRALFKEHYPNQYSKLLKDYGIVLKPQNELSTEEELWNNKLEEYRLPFENIVREYLSLNK